MSNNDSGPGDPHQGLHFWVQLGQIEVAGFRECSGIKIETEVEEYLEGGENTFVHKLPKRTKYQNITLKHGLDAGKDLYDWYMKGVGKPVQRENISIIVYNSQGAEVRRWNLKRAWPCKWSTSDFAADKGSTLVEIVELAHEGIVMMDKA